MTGASNYHPGTGPNNMKKHRGMMTGFLPSPSPPTWETQPKWSPMMWKSPKHGFWRSVSDDWDGIFELTTILEAIVTPPG